MTTLLITILPSLLIVLFFVKSDRFPEPTNQIIKIFFYGIFLCFPAYYLNTAYRYLFKHWSQRKFNFFFLSAAPVEEILKFTVLYSVVYKMKILMNQ